MKNPRPRILVVGDLMLDAWCECDLREPPPESPGTPAVRVARERYCPGGAANVVANLILLGADVTSVGMIGEDDEAAMILATTPGEGFAKWAQVPGRPTTRKTRLSVAGAPTLRVDHEVTTPPPPEVEEVLLELIAEGFDGYHAVALADYGKGVLSPTILRTVIDSARMRGIPVVVDPKGPDWTKYRGASVLKCNRAAWKVAVDIAQPTHWLSRFGAVAVTSGPGGLTLLTDQREPQHVPAPDVGEPRSVCGAGDVVTAVLAYDLARGLLLPDACRRAVRAASGAVARCELTCQLDPADLREPDQERGHKRWFAHRIG